MGLIADLQGDAKTLEELNIHMHQDFSQQDKDLQKEDRDARTFEKKAFLNKEVEGTLKRRDEILSKLDKEFGGDDKFLASPKTRETFEREANGTRSSRTTDSSRRIGIDTRSSSNYSSTSRYSSYSGSSSSSSGFTREKFERDIRDAEKKSITMFNKAGDYAKKLNSPRQKRMRKREGKSFLDRVFPPGSKKKRRALSVSIVAVEMLIMTMALYQIEIHDKMFFERKARWEALRKENEKND